MPTPMFVALDWIPKHCVIPDGDDEGAPFIPSQHDQLPFIAQHYTVRDNAKPGEKASAFTYRRSLYVRAQKVGKSPLIAAVTCLEGVGPALFAGWATGGEEYRCEDHGCGCGWVYEYVKGEPMGRQWPTPLIQITASTEDQTQNTYDALRPMVEKGPLAFVIESVREEFMRLPNGGRIDTVTSKATTRLGQRVTFCPQDETGIWTDANGMKKVARTQRRGLAAMGGRAIETTNAWDPSEHSQAQETYEAKAKDVLKDFVMPPAHLSFANRADRREILKFNYRHSPWADLKSIEAECSELMGVDPAEAERFYGNRLVAGSNAWLPRGLWESAYSGGMAA